MIRTQQGNKNIICISAAILLLFSCAQPKMLDMFTYELNGVEDDPTYGYTEINPIRVGDHGKDVQYNDLKYINALRGPNGETLTFHDLGSCCQGLSKRKKKENEVLHIFEVRYDSLVKPIILFLDLYDYEPLYAPIGLTYEITPKIYDFGDNEELMKKNSAYLKKKKDFRISGKLLQAEAESLEEIEDDIDAEFEMDIEDQDKASKEVRKINRQLERLEKQLAKEDARLLTVPQSDVLEIKSDTFKVVSVQDSSIVEL